MYENVGWISQTWIGTWKYKYVNKYVNRYKNISSLILPEDEVMLRNVVNNKVVFLSLCGRC